jgi:hypothetical protein
LTLAEVLAALVVLSIGLVAMVSVLPPVSSGIQEGGYRSGAAFLALQRLEEARRAVGLTKDDLTFPDEPTLPWPHEAFSRTVRTRDCGLAPGCSGAQSPGVRQVIVTVTYPAPAGLGVDSAHRGAVVLTTYIGPR